MGSKRRNTLTRFLEDIVDDTKDLVDDLIDRAKDMEEEARDAVQDVVDDDEDDVDLRTGREMESLKASLAELTARVNQLTELQIQAAQAAQRPPSDESPSS